MSDRKRAKSPPPADDDPLYARTCNRCGTVRDWVVNPCPRCGGVEFAVDSTALCEAVPTGAMVQR